MQAKILASIAEKGLMSRVASAAEWEFFACMAKRECPYGSVAEVDERTRQLIAETTARFAIGHVLGLCAPFLYESMQAALAAENAQRAKTKEAGGVVYGPLHFDETGYFAFVSGGVVPKIHHALASLRADGAYPQLMEALIKPL